MSRAAATPPEGLPGLDPAWSRIVAAPGVGADAGRTREWHVLDTGAALAALGVRPRGTILAVHGNPTWSYLWRSLLAASLERAAAGEPAWRVVAVDQLDMGYSERTGTERPLPQRVADLGTLTAALGLDGPVVTMGHDWGGVVSLGWAVDHPDALAGVLLLNTAVHHPAGVPIPAPLRLARARGVLAASTVSTTAFLDTTLSLARPGLDAAVRDAYRAPYASAARRGGIGGFVRDIPVDATHDSFAELERIAAGVARLRVPAFLQWGPEDPIFGDRYLADLVERLPRADVHRYERAGHLVAEERPYADAAFDWLAGALGEAGALAGADASARPSDLGTGPDDAAGPIDAPTDAGAAQADAPTDAGTRAGDDAHSGDDAAFVPLWRALDERADDDATAVIDMSSGSSGAGEVSWRRLHDRVQRIAAGLHALGVRRGTRVSLLVQPGPTLTAVVYACVRIGAIVVVADAGLGVRGLTRAVRGARPEFIIGQRPGLAAASVLGWPGVRISAERLTAPLARTLGVTHSLGEVARLGRGRSLPPEPSSSDLAAILFTSGSTGPAKGVVYTHAQLAAVRDVLAAHFEVTAETGLVTGFAPFALLGPALGTRSATPDMDVSSPRTLTARAVAAAVRASDARIVFLSPAAILNVVATADELDADDHAALGRVHTFLSTGAPVGTGTLESAASLMPAATAHTPYGMTECLLVTDITLDELRAADAAPDAGVCVGAPIGDNRVLVSALDDDGLATGAASAHPGVLGEVLVSAPHLKQRYDRLWITDREAARETATIDTGDAGARRWHRTGDVGHLDGDGRLWIEGRAPHVLVTERGPLAPVGTEQDVERVPEVRRAALAGVGPRGVQQAVAVVETLDPAARPALADPALTAAIRASTTTPLAAVFVVPKLPTDIRHNSKIDRSRLSAWAEHVLAGGRVTAP